MSTFVKGLAWTVAFLSGVATIFALFGGQQWLEQQGWTLAPSTDPDINAVEQTTEATSDTSQATEIESAEQESTDDNDTAQAPEFTFASLRAWSDEVFANLLWGIAAVGCSMLVAGSAGALVSAAQIPISYFVAFLQWVLAIACVAAVILMGFLLHGADPGYLVWFCVLTGISAPLGFMVHDIAEYG
ncbi:hypothetical protein O1R50_10780 [Glycomyces luteolus]|uniref:Uncharacterized protein n=1 Tax=Glycomyces luteolus TaxID=2670330 RepID=A0A9X3PAR9_9ACTN|nr:hypothetical protein [Glycomyces luteolus]MDA1360113.1 hypothetical protein [Glycomyces luteolus]